MPTQDTESVKRVVAQAQDSVYVRRSTKVTSEDDSKDQHLRHSFNILKEEVEDGPMEQRAWQRSSLYRLGGIQLEVIDGDTHFCTAVNSSSVVCLIEEGMMRYVS